MSAVFPDGTQLDWSLSPLAALARWPVGRRVLFLHSGRFDPRWARYSILAQPVGDYRFLGSPDASSAGGVWTGPPDLLPRGALGDNPFHDLRALSAIRDVLWIGHLSYDLGLWSERHAAAHTGAHAQDDRHWPVIELGCCPGWLVHDAQTNRWSSHGHWRDDFWRSLPSLPEHRAPFAAANLRSDFSRPAYEAAVARAIDYIAAGDIFQVNLSQRFTADFTGPYPLAHRAAYARLAAVSPAWYGAYLELSPPPSRGLQARLTPPTPLPTSPPPSAIHDPPSPPSGGGGGRVIASTSPELFLEVDTSGAVVTRPIKGTRPASVPAQQLLESVKDQAELNMIVDLLRNDLGRVCAYGSVRVPQPRVIESHPSVHHGVATITGRLHSTQDLADLLRSAMPGGSVTGAPKVRAMQIIDQLEPVARGPYCGALGFIHGKAASFNIAIRTMLLDPALGRVDFSVGGGIVADSNPADEYDETITKARVILETLGLNAKFE